MTFQNLCEILGMLVVAISLTSCGSSKGDRALSGGAIGAGVGAGVGAATDKDDINLGD